MSSGFGDFIDQLTLLSMITDLIISTEWGCIAVKPSFNNFIELPSLDPFGVSETFIVGQVSRGDVHLHSHLLKFCHDYVSEG